MAAGCFIYSYGVFLPVVCNEFHWSRAVVASGLSLGLLGLGLPAPLIGICVARFGSRVPVILGNAGMAACLAGLSFTHEIWQLFVLFCLAGVFGGFGGYLAVNSVASNWFVKKRSLAMGILAAFMGLGGFIFPPLTTLLVTSLGWQTAWRVLAGIALLFAGLVPGLLIRNRPEDIGQLPDGLAKPSAASEIKSPTGMEIEPAGWTIKQVLKQRTIWLIVGFSAAYFFISGTMNSHQIAYLQDLGANPFIAATTLSVVSAVTIIGNLSFGALALKFKIRYLVSIAFVIQLVALSILITTRSLSLIYLYAVLLGFSNGVISTSMPTIIGAYYGREHFARVMGTTFPICYVFLAAAPAVAGAIFDSTGTYRIAFTILLAFSIAGLLCAFFARKPGLSIAYRQPTTSIIDSTGAAK